MSIQRVCSVLGTLVTDHDCMGAIESGHYYCINCHKIKRELNVKSKTCDERHVNLIIGMLADAVQLITEGPKWIDSKIKYWSARGTIRSARGRRRFVMDYRFCGELRRDINDAGEWIANDDEHVGSFMWILGHLGTWGELRGVDFNIDPNKLRERLGIKRERRSCLNSLV